MELISQHAKKIMEECKNRARDEGLSFDDETLEYLVTNRDLLELSPKHMIPTLYDYWLHDIEVLREKGKYELYPNNPYETVINSRPAISFYNDNNPDWLNVMIFYHVLGHIDFFQNNLFFKHTWDDDFVGMALADKRLIARLRSEHGRWVDYIIEFARAIDNIINYFHHLKKTHTPKETTSKRLDYYFDVFLQKEKKMQAHEYLKEIDAYNAIIKENPEFGENVFFSEILNKFPEFEALYERYKTRDAVRQQDLLQYLIEHSPFMKINENKWMRSVLQIARNTSMYFQPQIRTKICNEGWASYWHEKLFLKDDRIKGNEVNFAAIHARVTGVPKVGLNPYAIGMRLITDIEDRAEKGKLCYEYDSLSDSHKRKIFDKKTGNGKDVLLKLREESCDFTLINNFCDQEFVDRYKLFVVGRRLNPQRRTWEYFVKSKRAEDYKQMLIDSLYHPPYITINEEKTNEKQLVLDHHFEGKGLVEEYIGPAMLGIEYLWGAEVHLRSHQLTRQGERPVEYVMKNKKLEIKKL